MKIVVELSAGLSGADINEVCLRLQRRHITRHETPQLRDAFEALRNLATGEGEQRRFLARFKDDSPAKIAETLRRRDPNSIATVHLHICLQYQKQRHIAV